MRRFLFNLLACLALVGCSDDYEGVTTPVPSLTPRQLAVSESTLSFTANATETKSLDITSVSTPWQIENGINWVTLSETSGDASATVMVNATRNSDSEQMRTGIFYVASKLPDWIYELPVTVNQEANVPVITLSETSFRISENAQSWSVDVTANCTWEATSDSWWLEVSSDKQKITLSVPTNPELDAREAVVYVRNTGTTTVTQMIKVTQDGACIKSYTEMLVFNNGANQVVISIESQAPWKASTTSSWVEVSPASGVAGTADLTISVAPNPATTERSGSVLLEISSGEYAGRYIEIPIQQERSYVEVVETELLFTAHEQSLLLTLYSNTGWRITGLPAWATAYPTEGTYSTEVSITVEENNQLAARKATIYVEQEGATNSLPVVLTQQGMELALSETKLFFSDVASAQTVELSSATGAAWQVQSNESWITLDPSAGTGDATLTIRVSENAGEERTGSITVATETESITITVVQQGKYFTISDDALRFTSRGGTLEVTITSNDTWTAQIENEAEWLSLSEPSGTGNVEVSLVAADNPSVNEREATVLFETSHSQTVRLVVTQAARFLTVDTKGFFFYMKGGDSEPATISTDGTYRITCSEDWLSVSETGNTFIVSATVNETGLRRQGTILIELTDLVEGTNVVSLPVEQLNKEGSFIKEGYGVDQSYDKAHSLKLTLHGFSPDENREQDFDAVQLSIMRFTTDKDRETQHGGLPSVNLQGFSTDKDRETQHGGLPFLIIQGFSTDKDRETQHGGLPSLIIQGFGKDHNWDDAVEQTNKE